jgi:hypothetical protein
VIALVHGDMAGILYGSTTEIPRVGADAVGLIVRGCLAMDGQL